MGTVGEHSSRNRIVIDRVEPVVVGGACFAAKTIIHEPFEVRAALLCDGHEELAGDLLYCHAGHGGHETAWSREPLVPRGNDVWAASFVPDRLGRYRYTVEAWLDPFQGWRRDTLVRLATDTLTRLELVQGCRIIENFGRCSLASGGAETSQVLRDALGRLEACQSSMDLKDLAALLDDRKLSMVCRNAAAANDADVVRREPTLELIVDPEVARTGSWYEFFPRSFGGFKEPHGAERMLDYVAELGFDVVYLPPIHPVGRTNRKGKNNSLRADGNDVGSPWAVGSAEGGHKAINPELGTMADFDRFVARAGKLGLKVALDVAFQCSPDHPYVREHPDWFGRRPDGSIQYAENPPKKYEDIYPLDFQCPDRDALWHELKSVFSFWRERGISIFRVDNPHTKALAFWEWAIGELKAEHPELVFLSEAFTRPKLMNYLAKAGFSQSYTYFTWRSNKRELAEYFAEVHDPEVAAYFRPNFWPNTPDILANPLRNGSPTDFAIRLVLAATASPSYGVYGPAFELCENRPRDDHSEEYLDSEKYELKSWDIGQARSLGPLLRKINRIRRSEGPLRGGRPIRIHDTTSEKLLAYSFSGERDRFTSLCVVNLDAKVKQVGGVDFPLAALGWPDGARVPVTDLLGERTFDWTGSYHYIELDPMKTVAHVFRVPKP